MIRLSVIEAEKLIQGAQETTEHPSNWNGAYELIVDRSYQLADGSILDFTVLNGWMYEGRLYSASEAKELAHKCPQNVHMEWGAGF